MKQFDRRARMNGGRPGMVGAIYVDEADLGEAAVQSFWSKVHSEIRSFACLKAIDLGRNDLTGIAAGGVALAQPTICRIAGQIVGKGASGSGGGCLLADTKPATGKGVSIWIRPASAKESVIFFGSGQVPRTGPQRSPPTSLARSHTPSSISRVSRPVNVFCWLGWKEPSSRRRSAAIEAAPDESTTASAPCPNFGLGRGIAQPRFSRARSAFVHANPPSATTTQTDGSSGISASSHDRH